MSKITLRQFAEGINKLPAYVLDKEISWIDISYMDLGELQYLLSMELESEEDYIEWCG